MGRGRTGDPLEADPRLFRRGNSTYWSGDFRQWGGPRCVLRDPSDPRWPKRGEKTEAADVAKEWASEYVLFYREGIRRRQLGLPDPAEPLGDAVRAFNRSRSRQLSQKAYEGGRTWSRYLLDWFGARTPVDKVSAAMLQREFDALLDAGYATSTLHTGRNLVSAFFRDHGRGHNPAREVELPDLPEPEADAWTDEEIERLRKHAPTLRHRRALELALATGGRKMELVALEWSDLDPREKTVRFRRQGNRTGRATRPLKGKRGRTALVLPSWWAHHDPEGEGYVLSDGLLSEKAAHELYAELLDAADLSEPGVLAHKFRHTYGRLFLEMGGWVDELQRSLGHASSSTTERVYAHFQTDKAAYFARDRIYGEGRARRLRVVDGEG